MAIRNVAIPLLSGGALLFGYAAFSWLRGKHARTLPNGPSTLREAGLAEWEERQVSAAAEAEADDVGPLSQRVPEIPELRELELDFEGLPDEQPALLHDSVAPEDIGARFLARVTDALSPFGGNFEQVHLDLDPSAPRRRTLSEPAHGEDALKTRTDEEIASESRPNAARVGGRA